VPLVFDTYRQGCNPNGLGLDEATALAFATRVGSSATGSIH
jgi:hypothetical protein